MWLRRAFFLWMFPAAIVLPVWLLVGWIAFDASGWALVPLLFIAMPGVFVAELILAFLVRARASVRDDRAVSWRDVLGFGVWHALIVASGFYPSWYGAILFGALLAAVGVFWLTISQLWREAASGVRTVMHAADGTAYIPPVSRMRAQPTDAEVIVIAERPSAE
jgi:hypothetical protein